MKDDILAKFGLKYEDLNAAERETYHTMLQSLQQSELTVAAVKGHISAMRESVEQELSQMGHGGKQDIFLKARLRNYLLLEAFLTSPEKAKAALERALAGIRPGQS